MSSSAPKFSSNLADRLAGLQEISLELVNAKDTHSILQLVVARAMDLLSCDAGSIYLRERGETLSFEVALNKSITFDFQRTSIPLSRRSLAQTVYLSGRSLNIIDAYDHRDKEGPWFFDDSFDRNTGYRTRSILAVPLKSSNGRILGVLQLINRKESPDLVWPSQNEAEIREMPTFSEEDLRLIESFAAVSASAIDNSRLKASIENLFESFIRASVLAIDSRDPGTRGHSERVTKMTVALARKISELPDAPYADVEFTEIELKELYYAGLLHDFGKIAVREATLQKEQKLTEVQRLKIEARVNDFLRSYEHRQLKALIEVSRVDGRGVSDLELKKLENDVAEFRTKLQTHHELILTLSKPTVLDDDKSKKLSELTSVSYNDWADQTVQLLSAEEVQALSIKRGCLTESERLEIESHVTHSYNFLSQIPWDERFARVPEIAFGHHELLDGTGYPRKLKRDEIPVASRIMTICDIFDALASSDRPYKKALSIARTLEIIAGMVEQGKIEGRFFQAFCDHRIWEACEIYQGRDVQKAA